MTDNDHIDKRNGRNEMSNEFNIEIAEKAFSSWDGQSQTDKLRTAPYALYCYGLGWQYSVCATDFSIEEQFSGIEDMVDLRPIFRHAR